MLSIATNKIIIFITIVFALLSASKTIYAADDSPCTKDDADYANHRNNYYKPEDAYEFGLKIQYTIRQKDLKKLFELVDGELLNGPRKSYVKGKKMSDIFSEDWQARVLSEKPPCQPVGWRGFMLGNGMIWYNKSEKGWHVFSVNGWKEEEFTSSGLPITWDVDGLTLSHQCFIKIWMSGDNFEEYEKKYRINDVKDFRQNLGKYLGKEIPVLKPIVPSWADKGETISLVGYVNQCAVDKNSLNINNRSIQKKICTDGKYCTEYEYEILDKISKENCSKLAPNIPGQCKNAYLVKIGDYSGGSIGWQFQFNIYGLFVLPDKSKIVAPLVNFYSENESRNFVDTLK